MKKIFSFLSPDPGATSAMRLMGVISLLIAGGLSFYGLHKDIDPEKLAWLVAVFVTSAFGGKALQKKFEFKNIAETLVDKPKSDDPKKDSTSA